MTRFQRGVTALGAAAVALAAAGPAAAAWTPSQELPGTAGRYPLFAALDAGGARHVGVQGPLAFLPLTAPQVPVAISSAPVASAFGAPALLAGGAGAPVALSPKRGLMLAVAGPRSPLDYFSLERVRARLRVRIGPLGGPLHGVATGSIVATKSLASAINDRRDAAVVFSRCVDTRCATRTVLATYRRRGGRFATPVVLARRTGYPVGAVALNAHGDALFAWIQHRVTGRGNDVRVRVRRADGRLSKPQLAGPSQPVPQIAVTLTGERRGVVAWFSEGVGEGSGGGPLTVTAASVRANGTLGSSRVLDTGTPGGTIDNAPHGLRLGAMVDRAGATTVAWTGYFEGHYVVRALRLFSGATQTLSPAGTDAQLADLAGDTAGDAIAAWVPASNARTTPGIPGVFAAIRPAGAVVFGPAELALLGQGVAGTAAAAIGPGGRAVVAGAGASAINDTSPGVRVAERAAP